MAFGALFRFEIRTGARVAARWMVPILVGMVAGPVFLGPAFIESLAAAVYPGGEWPGVAQVAVGMLVIVFALVAVERMGVGRGWIRHLPASDSMRRRAACLACLLATLPVLYVLGGLVATRWITGSDETVWSGAAALVGLPLLGLGAAGVAMSRDRTVLVMPAAVCVVAAGGGNWWWWLVAAVNLVLWDRLADRYRLVPRSWRRPTARLEARGAPSGKPKAKPAWTTGRWFPWLTTLLITWLITLRALGLVRIAGMLLTGLLPLSLGALFVFNNSLPESVVRGAGRLAGGVAVTVFLVSWLERASRICPQWQWARSLPISSQRRVRYDAVLSACAAMPIVLVVSVFGGLTVLSIVPLLVVLSLRAAGLLRTRDHDAWVGGLQLGAEGVLMSMLSALVPWTAFGLLLWLPFVDRWAARCDRQLRVTTWDELRHRRPGGLEGLGEVG